MIVIAATKVATGVKTGAFHLFFSITHANNPTSAVQKVGNFVKTTGAKIAKFGLQVLSTATSIASKVAKFIPVVGKVVSTALKAESKVEEIASDAIHVQLSKKLTTGISVLKKIQHPVCKYCFFLCQHFGRQSDIFVRCAAGVLGTVLDNIL